MFERKSFYARRTRKYKDTYIKVFDKGVISMANVRKNDKKPQKKYKPAEDPKLREDQLISLAIDRAEKQLKDGTASSQIIAHFLKQGSARERLEKERLQTENELLKAKIEALKSQERSEEMYSRVLKALSTYTGKDFGEEEPIDE